MTTPSETIEVGDLEVAVTNPDKVFFPALGLAKRDLVRYCIEVMPGVLAGASDLAEAPYPPHFPKAPGEPDRVQPSKAKGSRARSSAVEGAEAGPGRMATS